MRKELETEIGTILFRPYEERDLPFHLNYLFETTPEFRASIGLDNSKLVDREEWKTKFLNRLHEAHTPRIIVGEWKNETISMMIFDKRTNDVDRLHFHILKTELRGRGLGGPIFMHSLTILSELQKVKSFLIEPRSTNHRMNGLMRKLGFKYLTNFTMPAGPMTLEMESNRYEINLP